MTRLDLLFAISWLLPDATVVVYPVTGWSSRLIFEPSSTIAAQPPGSKPCCFKEHSVGLVLASMLALLCPAYHPRAST
ncbi:hypothetical protein F5Y14DRAFT_428032 [Nemania sp. NC0429]|nr:hypothetical protein F5Y14DRAFT_428032 [Nemania sp. NC0429]